MNKWWTAKIKPLDGTEVLGAVLGEDVLFHEIVTWDSRDGVWTLAGDEQFEVDVKFWMELPEMPKLSKKK
jgi:hypothetical protein